MKKLLTILLSLLALSASAQETLSEQEYLRRYNNLVNRVGAAGLGVETLLNKWEADYPDDTQQMLARFSFYFTRCQISRVVQLPQDRYLGREPLLPMKDSLGQKANFFEVTDYDDELYAQANLAIDKAIAALPDRLDLRLAKIDAMMAFENVRVKKEVSNRVNRQLNCDNSNINRSMNAAETQIRDIRYIDSELGLEKLPRTLRDMAYIRSNNPEMPLAELGELMDPPLGKSGVNARLRRISAIAEKLRCGDEVKL